MAAWSCTRPAIWPTIGDADGGVAADRKVEAGFGEQRITRDRHAGDREGCAGVQEGEPRARRHTVEGVLPGERGARDQHHVIRQLDDARGTDAERGVADLERVGCNIERRRSAALGRRVGVEPDPGAAGERLDRDIAERETVTGLAEHLRGAGIVARGRAIEEARERDGAVGVDAVRRIGAAGAQVERAEAPAAIARHMRGIDIGAAASVETVARSRIARSDPRASALADARVEARDEAREIAPHTRGIAVGAEAAPRAETLRPEHDVAVRGGGDHRCLGDDRRLRIAERRVHLLLAGECRRAAEREGRRAGRAAIGGLAQAAEHRAAHVAALVHQHAGGRGMHLAGERIERGGKLRVGQGEQLADRRQPAIEGRILRAADGALVGGEARQRRDVGAQRHQQHVGCRVGQARAQGRRQARRRHGAERAGAPAGGGEDRVGVRAVGAGREDQLRGAGQCRGAGHVGAVGGGRRDLDLVDTAGAEHQVAVDGDRADRVAQARACR